MYNMLNKLDLHMNIEFTILQPIHYNRILTWE